MERGEGVVLTVVSDGPEADLVCGLLRSAGIDCAYRDTEAIDSVLEDFTAAGPREIIVRESDVEAAPGAARRLRALTTVSRLDR